MHIVFDGGANIGIYSVMAAKIIPSMKIHAFEPGKGTFHFLRKYMFINELLNVRVQVHELAVSDQDAQF